jgi:predicted transcriptional regulator
MGYMRTLINELNGIPRANPGITSAVEHQLVSLPAWFPAEKAAAILRHHATSFAFVTDRAGISGTVSLADVATAPQTKTVSWIARPLGQAIPLDTTVAEALASMHHQALDHLPVAVGGLIIGIVTRAALTAIAPVEPSARPLAA